jgi:hypothetical protein
LHQIYNQSVAHACLQEDTDIRNYLSAEFYRQSHGRSSTFLSATQLHYTPQFRAPSDQSILADDRNSARRLDAHESSSDIKSISSTALVSSSPASPAAAAAAAVAVAAGSIPGVAGIAWEYMWRHTTAGDRMIASDEVIELPNHWRLRRLTGCALSSGQLVQL